jgi:hypothetical protein
MRFRVTAFDVEKQYALQILNVCVYSCPRYLVCNAHAPYYIVIRHLSGSIPFFHIIS